jgi:hypothetical protein
MPDTEQVLALTPLVTDESAYIVLRTATHPDDLLRLALSAFHHKQPVVFQKACSDERFSQNNRLRTVHALANKEESPITTLSFTNMAYDHNPQKALEEHAYFHRRAEGRHETSDRADITGASALFLAHKLTGTDWKKAIDFCTKAFDKPFLQKLLKELGGCYPNFTTKEEQAPIKAGLERVVRDELSINEMTCIHIIQTFLTPKEIQEILDQIQRKYTEEGRDYMWIEIIEPYAIQQGLIPPKGTEGQPA